MAEKQKTIQEKWKDGGITIFPPKNKSSVQKSPKKPNRNQKTNKKFQK